MAGYSKTPLVKKLGIKPNFLIMPVNAPSNYWELLGTLPENVQVVDKKRPVEHTVDFIHFFSKSADELQNEIHSLQTSLKKRRYALGLMAQKSLKSGHRLERWSRS